MHAWDFVRAPPRLAPRTRAIDDVGRRVQPSQQYFVVLPADTEKLTVLKNEEGLQWSVYFGVGGMTGACSLRSHRRLYRWLEPWQPPTETPVHRAWLHAVIPFQSRSPRRDPIFPSHFPRSRSLARPSPYIGQIVHHAWREHSQAKPVCPSPLLHSPCAADKARRARPSSSSQAQAPSARKDLLHAAPRPVPSHANPVQDGHSYREAAGPEGAGSEEKVAFIKSLGADVAFNYKTERTRDALARAGPFDMCVRAFCVLAFCVLAGRADKCAEDTGRNRRGDARRGVGRRAVHLMSSPSSPVPQECSMISAYNGEEPYHVKNLLLIVGKQLKLSGFIVMWLHENHLAHFYEMFPRRVKEGKIKYTEDATRGLERAGHTIVDVQTGWNKGKSVMIVSEE
ncbi:hypothetical protein WOLCODRAFT_167666 [Wolfiporia cocos MD-104 SS10]|uniref:Alcohol dehydrogenase-like C-terminal domain-containing protein n=1 Tax=Wolfiporia cocos (strain MD-104) TaxID=742152 RepID=A0A2H3JJA6_WOLCO|nr:hypothetical protein WOLCODRAFT_167666 [Wolfiporia cocos MD-104 SS10]